MGPGFCIGKRATEHLISKGYFVYAGTRKQKDIDALNAMKNVEAVRLDVTFQDDIDKAVKQISIGDSYDRDALVQMLDEALKKL